jgi:hypothetical protein
MAMHEVGSFAQETLPKVLLVLLLALVFLVSFRPVFSNDVWLHLKVGEVIAKNHLQLPNADPFSYTTSGRPWILHEWLSQLILYETYTFGGFTALRLLRSAVETLTLALFFWTAYRQTRRYVLSVGILLAMAYLLQTRFHIRPEVFSHLFMGLFCLTYFTTHGHKVWHLLPVCLAFIVWINLHSFMIIVIPILLIGLISGGLTLMQPFKRIFAKPSGTKFKAAMLILAILAVFVTPRPGGSLHYALSGSQVARSYIMEWQPIFISLQNDFFLTLRGAIAFPILLKVVVLSVIILFLGGLAWSILRKGAPRWPLDHALIGLMMIAMALSAIRFVWLLSIPLLLTAGYFCAAFGAMQMGKTGALAPGIVGWSLLSAGSVFWINAGTTAIPLNMHGTIENHRFPTSVAQLLKEVHLDGHMFNPYGWGGYLIFHLYPDYKVFVDGRTVLHGASLLRDHYTILHGNPGYQGLIEKAYQFDFMILPKQYGMIDRPPSGTYVLLFENYNSSLYLKRNTKNQCNLEQFAEYYKSNQVPFDAEKGFDIFAVIHDNPEWARRYRLEEGSAVEGQNSVA